MQETPSLDRLYKLAAAQGDQNLPALPEVRAPRFDVRKDLKTKTHKDWSATYGKASTFLADVEAAFDPSGAVDMTQATIQADAGVRIFDSPRVEVLRADGRVQAPASGNVKARGTLRLGGKSVFDESFETGILRKEVPFEAPIVDAKTPIRFMVGPIPVVGELGVNGTAGIKLVYEATLLNASASLVPRVSGDGYAQVAADVVVAKAGVGGTLRVIEASNDLKGYVRVDLASEGGPALEALVDSRSTIELLSGKLYAFVEAFVPWQLGTKTFKRDLYAWNGIRKDLGRTIAFRKKTSARSVIIEGDADPEDAIAKDLDRYERDRVEALLIDAKARDALLADFERAALGAIDTVENGALADFWARFPKL